MSSTPTYRPLARNMADIAPLIVLVLATVFSGVESATVSISGSTGTVTLPNTILTLTCSYTLAVNETAQNLKWTKGSTSILTWTISATPAPTKPWSTVTYSPGTVTIHLPAASVTKSNEGMYTCTVVSTGASAGTSSKNHTVTIQYKPEISLPTSPSGIEGSTVNVECTVSANPSSSITWKHGSSEIATVSGKVLNLSNIKRSQDGVYTCIASNSVGMTQKNVSVVVYYLDVPKLTLSNTTVVENGTISMICSASSKPAASITIDGPGKSKRGTDRYTFNASCSDTGSYQCSASNSKITNSKKVSENLTVLCKPRKNSTVPQKREFIKNLTESVVFEATLIALPMPTFQWTRKTVDTGEITVISNETGHFEMTSRGTKTHLNITILSEDDYGEYTLKAKNSQGETTLEYFLRSQTVPYKVTTLGVANVTTDSITVVWSSSFNGGTQQEYFIQYLSMADTQQEAWIQKTTHISDAGRKKNIFARISDIYPGRTYRIRVFSVNQFGQSEYSNVVNATTSDLLSFGVGIVVGMIIILLVMAAAIGGFFLYRRKFKPLKKENKNGCNRDNPAFSRQISESGTGHYSALDGEREKPPTYDVFNKDQPVYQNVENKQDITEPSTPEVYMNFVPDQSDKSGGMNPNSKQALDGQLYANA